MSSSHIIIVTPITAVVLHSKSVVDGIIDLKLMFSKEREREKRLFYLRIRINKNPDIEQTKSCVYLLFIIVMI